MNGYARALATKAAQIERAISKFDAILDEALRADDESRPTFEDLAGVLKRLDQSGKGLTQQLAIVRDRVRSACAKCFPRRPGPIVVEHVGTLDRCLTGATTDWEGKQLALVVAARVADECVDPESGEVLPVGVICEKVALAIVACAGLDAASKQWRKTDLGRFGIDPKSYSTTRGGQSSVRFL